MTTIASSALQSVFNFNFGLAEGWYSMHLEAADTWGNVSDAYIDVAWDFTPPEVTPTFELTPESDGLPAGDGMTPFDHVTLFGIAEPETSVFVLGQEEQTLTEVDFDGQFVLRNVSLSPGQNTLTVVSRDRAGNSTPGSGSVTFGPTTCLGPDAFGYEACLVEPQFIDISATGQSVPIDGTWIFTTLSTADLDGFAFDFYGESHTTLLVSPVGGILLSEVEPSHSAPGNLMDSPVYPAIAVFWDNFDEYNFFAGAQLFWQLDGPSGDRRLIMQWQDVLHGTDESPMTFQTVLHESDGAIEFNYLDVDGESSDPYRFYWSVQGIKGPGEQDLAGNMLLLGHGGLNQFSQSGVSVRIALSQAPAPPAAVPGAIVQRALLDFEREGGPKSRPKEPALPHPRLTAQRRDPQRPLVPTREVNARLVVDVERATRLRASRYRDGNDLQRGNSVVIDAAIAECSFAKAAVRRRLETTTYGEGQLGFSLVKW